MIWGTRTALKTPPATSRKIRFGRLLALMKVSVTVEPSPRAAASIQVFPKPRKRETRVPAAMTALERASPGWAAWAAAAPEGAGFSEGGLAADIVFIVSPGRAFVRNPGTGAPRAARRGGRPVRRVAAPQDASAVFGQDFPGEVRDAALIREGELAGQFVERDPGDVDGFLVRIVLDGQFPTGGLQEVVVDGLVHAVPADGKPVVDASERRQDLAFDPGFLRDLADRGFLVAFLA